MNQTAVEWLLDKYIIVGGITQTMVEQAKEMERQQIIDTYISGYTNGVESMIDENLSVPSPEEYYNSTFKSE